MRKLVLATMVLFSLLSCNKDDDFAPLSQTEKDDLLTLREEEKLARDVYLYAFDKYALDISNNISQSEQKHMDKILSLLNRYDLADPASTTRGVFNNAELQTLYNDLTAQVDVSELEALKVGAIIEDLDIKDIEEFENRTDHNDILDAYSKLKCGSRNHMRAYYGQLMDNSFTYEAQFITSDALSAIIASGNEQCGRN